MSQARESGRPTAQEYAPYYDAYVQRVPPGDIVATLKDQLASASALLESIPPDKAHFRYAPGKWSVNELIGHLLDTEWTFTYRALRFARGDQTALAGIDQDVLVAGGNFDGRSLASLTEEFRKVRSANLVLFESFDGEVLARKGTASGCEFTVRSMLHILCGHADHHLAVLRDLYLT